MKLSEYTDELFKAGDDQAKKDQLMEAMVQVIGAEAAANLMVEKARLELKGRTHPMVTKVIGTIFAIAIGMFALAGLAWATRWLMQILGII